MMSIRGFNFGFGAGNTNNNNQQQQPAKPGGFSMTGSAFSFGSGAAQNTAGTGAAAGTTPALGGSSLFGSTPAAAKPTPTIGGGLFGAKPATAGTALGASTAATSLATPAAGGGLFGGAKPAATPFAATPFGGAKPAGSDATPAAAAGAKPTPVTNVSLGTLKNKTFDEVLSKWQTELDENVKFFHQKAKQISAWDRLLMENAHKVRSLNEPSLVCLAFLTVSR